MEDDDTNNKIVQNEPGESYDFKYNFVNTPWDDRSRKSKVGILSLLIALFIATMACVTYNLSIHFSKSQPNQSLNKEKCNLVKVDEYKFTARIHSVTTLELVCVGAVLSPNSVLANGVCVMSGPIRLRIGSLSDPRCKKGFSVDIIEQVDHDGVVSKHMVLLSSYENMAGCSQNVIKLGATLTWEAHAYIIGRPAQGGRSFSRQPAKLVNVEKLKPGLVMKDLNVKKTICVMDLGKCPVRASDLLIQNGHLFGLASTSTHATDQSKLACFADVRIVRGALKKMDPDIIEDTFLNNL